MAKFCVRKGGIPQVLVLKSAIFEPGPENNSIAHVGVTERTLSEHTSFPSKHPKPARIQHTVRQGASGHFQVLDFPPQNPALLPCTISKREVDHFRWQRDGRQGTPQEVRVRQGVPGDVFKHTVHILCVRDLFLKSHVSKGGVGKNKILQRRRQRNPDEGFPINLGI